MTTLILARHASSDWASPGLGDHDRTLNARGRRDAETMAARLAGSGVAVQRILCSSAVRARTTADAFAQALGLPAEPRADLYGAGARVLVEAAAGSGATSVLIVAHDPGMTVLAGRLSSDGIGAMPTCAVAVFRWDTDDWQVASSTDPDSWEFDAPRP